MKNLKKILLTFIFGLLLLVPNVNAEDVKNEVKLNFKGGTIHDGYVEYSEIGKIQLFKNDELVIDISNNMVIDLNDAEYKFVIKEIETEDSTSPFGPSLVRLKINNWYYVINNDSFKLDANNFSGDLNVELERKRVAFNIEVKNTYNDIKSTGVIDLTNGKEYVIDFSKTDELTEGLKSFADLDKTLYYQMFNESLLVTDDESVAVIKIVGNNKCKKEAAMCTASFLCLFMAKLPEFLSELPYLLLLYWKNSIHNVRRTKFVICNVYYKLQHSPLCFVDYEMCHLRT